MRDSAGIRRGVGLAAAGIAAVLVLPLPVPLPPGPLAAEATSRDLETLFEAKVRPLLVAKCQRCHGDKIAEAGLRLDSRRSMLAGSDTGPVVVPGDAAKSRLLAAVRHADGMAMPPDEKLSGDDVAALETWVAAGAPWSGPGGDATDGPPPTRAVAMAERITEAMKGHWAFRPPVRHDPPAVESLAALDPAVRMAWSGSVIDRFVAARLVAAGLSPAAEASPRDLFRRLCYDLTGLPPAAADADAFCARSAAGPEAADAAFREAVDRLLASPEHAEHWARIWLDLARYADTMGYAFDNQDHRYPFAWTYRDWVIDALHRDLPYDRFVTLQLAADRIRPEVPRSDLAALGFLTVGRTFLGNVHDIIDDRIDVVTRGLMGLTVACARCHDHKYEPLAAADYYALHGIFSSCRIPEDLPVIGDSPPGPDAEAFAAKLQKLHDDVLAHEHAVYARGTRDAVAHAADYLCEVARPAQRAADNRPPRLADGYELEQLVIDRLKRLLDGAPAGHPVLGAWAAVRGKADGEIGPGLEALMSSWGESPEAKVVNPLVRQELLSARPGTLRQLAEAYARLVARVAPVVAGGPEARPDEPAELAALRTLLGKEGTPFVVPQAEAMRLASRKEQTEHRRLKKEITKHTAEAVGGPPRAMALIDNDKPQDSHVFLRGNPGKHGERVERRLPTLLGGAALSRTDSGRLELAQAIVSAGNPLTPRVIVNWVWTHHMGRGLVDTPGDLGLRGEAPSHPELLDDLARRFVDEGHWSLRWLHREIVTSRTWRQSTAAAATAVERDPDNRLFGRASRRRLGWEAWRDSLLVAAGTLPPPSSAADHPAPVAAAGRGGPAVDPLLESAMHSRTVYGRLDRQDVPGIVRVFDVANPDTAVHVRVRTTVPQQSLAVLNAPLVVTASRKVAARVDREAAGGDDATRVDALWRAVLARSPTPDERSAALAWLSAEAQQDAAAPQPPEFGRWDRLAQAILATSEFQFVD